MIPLNCTHLGFHGQQEKKTSHLWWQVQQEKSPNSMEHKTGYNHVWGTTVTEEQQNNQSRIAWKTCCWYITSCIHTRWSIHSCMWAVLRWLASILIARCKGCGTEILFPTSSKVTCRRTNCHREHNLAAIWEKMATGGGFSCLQESMSVLGVPVMTKKSFMATECA